MTTAIAPPRLSRSRRIALAIGLPLVVLAVVYTGLGLVGLVGRVTVQDDTSYALPGDRHLALQAHGTITVTAGDVAEVQVRRTSMYGITAPSTTANVTDRGVELAGDCPWWNLFNCRISYDVVLPPDVSVDLYTGSGTIRVTGVDGAVAARTGSGSIHAEALGGSVALATGSGSVTAAAIDAESVRARSGSGSVRLALTGAPAEVDAHAGSGSIVIEVPRGSGPYRIDAATGSGSRTVEVRTDPSASAVLSAHAGSGNITIREAP